MSESVRRFTSPPVGITEEDFAAFWDMVAGPGPDTPLERESRRKWRELEQMTPDPEIVSSTLSKLPTYFSREQIIAACEGNERLKVVQIGQQLLIGSTFDRYAAQPKEDFSPEEVQQFATEHANKWMLIPEEGFHLTWEYKLWPSRLLFNSKVAEIDAMPTERHQVTGFLNLAEDIMTTLDAHIVTVPHPTPFD